MFSRLTASGERHTFLQRAFNIDASFHRSLDVCHEISGEHVRRIPEFDIWRLINLEFHVARYN